MKTVKAVFYFINKILNKINLNLPKNLIRKAGLCLLVAAQLLAGGCTFMGYTLIPPKPYPHPSDINFEQIEQNGVTKEDVLNILEEVVFSQLKYTYFFQLKDGLTTLDDLSGYFINISPNTLKHNDSVYNNIVYKYPALGYFKSPTFKIVKSDHDGGIPGQFKDFNFENVYRIQLNYSLLIHSTHLENINSYDLCVDAEVMENLFNAFNITPEYLTEESIDNYIKEYYRSNKEYDKLDIFDLELPLKQEYQNLIKENLPIYAPMQDLKFTRELVESCNQEQLNALFELARNIIIVNELPSDKVQNSNEIEDIK